MAEHSHENIRDAFGRTLKVIGSGRGLNSNPVPLRTNSFADTLEKVFDQAKGSSDIRTFFSGPVTEFAGFVDEIMDRHGAMIDGKKCSSLVKWNNVPGASSKIGGKKCSSLIEWNNMPGALSTYEKDDVVLPSGLAGGIVEDREQAKAFREKHGLTQHPCFYAVDKIAEGMIPLKEQERLLVPFKKVLDQVCVLAQLSYLAKKFPSVNLGFSVFQIPKHVYGILIGPDEKTIVDNKPTLIQIDGDRLESQFANRKRSFRQDYFDYWKADMPTARRNRRDDKDESIWEGLPRPGTSARVLPFKPPDNDPRQG